MKRSLLILGIVGFALVSCNKTEAVTNENTSESTEAVGHGQEGVKDDDSNPNVVQLAAKNPDLSTLVTAVKAAGLATSLSNEGLNR